MRRFCFLALFGLVSGSAFASPMLTIDLPLVGGIPTLSGTPGETLDVEATVTNDTSDQTLTITGDDPSVNGLSPVIVTAISLLDPNLGGTIAPGTTTTGNLLSVQFSDVIGSVTPVDVTVQYQLSGDLTTHEFTLVSPAFDVVTVASIAPEPSSTALLGLGLCGAALARRRQLSRR
jgi:PEP-CTERM motif